MATAKKMPAAFKAKAAKPAFAKGGAARPQSGRSPFEGSARDKEKFPAAEGTRADRVSDAKQRKG